MKRLAYIGIYAYTKKGNIRFPCISPFVSCFLASGYTVKALKIAPLKKIKKVLKKGLTKGYGFDIIVKRREERLLSKTEREA